MSQNIIGAVCAYKRAPLGLTASRRQVDNTGGYVCNFDARKFCDYVRKRNPGIVLERDHGGPLQGSFEDEGYASLNSDAYCFDIIHVDVWKKCREVSEAARITSDYIKFCERVKSGHYEVGTEQDIFAYSPEDLDAFLGLLQKELGDIFSQVLYAVIQSGTSLKETKNTGSFNERKLQNMIGVCKKYGLRSKEHNGDYLDPSLIKNKFALGLDSINIAPELGRLETLSVLDLMNMSQEKEFFNLCLRSGKWKKWVSKKFDPYSNRRGLIEICGHYLFSSSEFKELITGLEGVICFNTMQRIHKFIDRII